MRYRGGVVPRTTVVFAPTAHNAAAIEIQESGGADRCHAVPPTLALAYSPASRGNGNAAVRGSREEATGGGGGEWYG